MKVPRREHGLHVGRRLNVSEGGVHVEGAWSTRRPVKPTGINVPTGASTLKDASRPTTADQRRTSTPCEGRSTLGGSAGRSPRLILGERLRVRLAPIRHRIGRSPRITHMLLGELVQLRLSIILQSVRDRLQFGRGRLRRINRIVGVLVGVPQTQLVAYQPGALRIRGLRAGLQRLGLRCRLGGRLFAVGSRFTLRGRAIRRVGRARIQRSSCGA